MALRLPRHRIDATPKFVSAYDPVWSERLDRELAELADEAERRKAGEEPDAPLEVHPQRVFSFGWTRFDVDAPIRFRGVDVKVSDYWDGDPTFFVLAELPPDQRYRATSLVDQGQQDEAFLLCCRWGLANIENGPKYMRARDGRVSDETMSDLMNCSEIGAGLIHEIGAAVWLYNQSLSKAEKKA